MAEDEARRFEASIIRLEDFTKKLEEFRKALEDGGTLDNETLSLAICHLFEQLIQEHEYIKGSATILRDLSARLIDLEENLNY